MQVQVTYSEDAQRGYIYLVERNDIDIRCTGDLDEEGAHEFLLDFDKKWNIVGIELEGLAAEKIRPMADESHIFQKKLTEDGAVYYAFQLSDEKIKTTISHPKAKNVHFHFADVLNQENMFIRDFIGIDIFDNGFYSEAFLVGK
ncbi:MAG: hypothetical protein RR595_09325 [Lysinibacillus sp.]